MAKVLTSVLKFPPEQVQSVLEKEESKALVSSSSPSSLVHMSVSSYVDCTIVLYRCNREIMRNCIFILRNLITRICHFVLVIEIIFT